MNVNLFLCLCLLPWLLHCFFWWDLLPLLQPGPLLLLFLWLLAWYLGSSHVYFPFFVFLWIYLIGTTFIVSVLLILLYVCLVDTCLLVLTLCNITYHNDDNNNGYFHSVYNVYCSMHILSLIYIQYMQCIYRYLVSRWCGTNISWWILLAMLHRYILLAI